MSFNYSSDEELLDLDAFLKKNAKEFGSTAQTPGAKKLPELFRETKPNVTANPAAKEENGKKRPETTRRTARDRSKPAKGRKPRPPPPSIFDEDKDKKDAQLSLCGSEALREAPFNSTRKINIFVPTPGRKKMRELCKESDVDYSSDEYDYDDSFIDDRPIDKILYNPPNRRSKTPGLAPKTPATTRKKLVRGTELKKKPQNQPVYITLGDSDEDSEADMKPRKPVRINDSEDDKDFKLKKPSGLSDPVDDSGDDMKLHKPALAMKLSKPRPKSEDDEFHIPMGKLQLNVKSDAESAVPSIQDANIHEISSDDEFDPASQQLVAEQKAVEQKGIELFSDDEQSEASYQSVKQPSGESNSPASDPEISQPFKKKPIIPPTPFGASDDEFWNESVINNWNDMHSPQKNSGSIKPFPVTPRAGLGEITTLVSSGEDSQSEPTFNAQPRKRSSRKAVDPEKETEKEAKRVKREFLAIRAEFAANFLKELDEKLTGGRVGALYAATGGVQLNWSKTLRSTAGQAKQRVKFQRHRDGTRIEGSELYHGIIDLSARILDERQKVLDTLTHEFCHLAVMGLDKVLKGRPHGAEFKRWGERASKIFAHLGIKVTTQHTYELNHKYMWACTNPECDKTYGRNSKSIDPTKVVCSRCSSNIVQTQPKPREDRGLNQYQLYLKMNKARVQAENPGLNGKDLMKHLAAQYQASKPALTAEEESNLTKIIGDLKV